MNRRVCVTACAIALLAHTVSARAHDDIEYVIHITVDALRGDVLRNLIANTPASYPNFRRLETEGAFTYNARSDYNFTETIPNHATVLTGRPVSQPAGQPNTVHHGYSSNFPGPTHTIHADGNDNVPYKASVFDVAHDNGLRTALYASKTRLAIFDRSYDATNGAVDMVGADNGRDKVDVSMLVDGTSANITNTLVTNMTNNPTHYTFIHLVEPDTVGHSTMNWESAAWAASVQTIDSRLGQIFNLVQSSSTLNGHTAIVLTADHGGGVQIHVDETAWQNFNIPIYVWGAGLPANTDLYTLSPNRLDPGAMGRPDYNAAMQPWRNGDTGNLALSLLGLGPIPGSSMRPVLIPEPASALLAAAGGALLFTRRRRKSC
jgi:predicted AlkP superfamily pyrophosphatase or phosphodiesterase